MRAAFYARQVGTAAAFSPLSAHLAAQGTELLSLASAAAHPVMSTGGSSCRIVADFEEALTHLEVTPVDILVTGTSEHAADDARYWTWARARGVPSIAFVDQWSTYGERFAPGGSGRVEVAPDRIAVVDALAAARLAAVGAAPDSIVVVGSPALDALSEPMSRAAKTLRASLLAEHDADRICLLATEPIARDDTMLRALYGSTDLDCLEASLAALSRVAVENERRFLVVLRLHPRDTAERTTALRVARPGLVVVVRDDDKHNALRTADVVLGVRSMFLIEAAFVGCPTISVQLHRHEGADLTDGRKGIVVVEDEVSLEAAIRDTLADRPAVPSGVAGGLTMLAGVQRFAALVRSLAR